MTRSRFDSSDVVAKSYHRPLSSLFSLDLPYEPPSSAFGKRVWRWRIWLETTFGASVLTPGEKIAFIIVWSTILSLLLYAVTSVIPHALIAMYGRALFYVFGNDAGAVRGTTRAVTWNQSSTGTGGAW